MVTKLYLRVIFFFSVFALFSCYEEPESIAYEVPSIDPTLYERLADLPSVHGNNSPTIAQISDIHHFAPSLYNRDDPIFSVFASNNDGRTVLYSSEILESLRENLKSRGVESLLVSGDLSIWGSRITHEDLARIFREYENEGIQVFVTPGNHDVYNVKAARLVDRQTEKVDTVTPGEFRNIYNDFGYSQALIAHDESLSYMVELAGGVLLLSLDTASYEENFSLGYSVSKGRTTESLYEFVESSLELAGPRVGDMIVMTHHNLLEHYETDRNLENFMIDDGGQLLALLEGAGVNLAVSGHIHKSDIKRDRDSHFYSAALTSLALYPHIYRLISVDQNDFALSSERVSLIYGEKQNRIIEEYTQRVGFEKIYHSRLERLENDFDSTRAGDMAEYFYLINFYAQQGLESYIPVSLLNSPGAADYDGSASAMGEFVHILPLDSFPDDWQAVIPKK